MDKFNDMWKNRFNDGNMPIADWNTPDDEVWDAILPHVVEEKKKRFVWWIAYLLGGLTILFFMLKMGGKTPSKLGYFPVNMPSSIEKVNHTIENNDLSLMSNELNNNQSTKEVKPNNVNDTPLSDDSILSTNNNIPLSQPVIGNTTNLTKTKDNKLSESNIISGTDYRTENVGKNDLSELTIGVENIFLVPVDLLPIHLFMLDNQSPILDKMPNVIVEKTEKKQKISVVLAAGAMFWNHSISGAYQNDLAAFDFNYTNNTGSFIATQLSTPINSKLRFFTGLQLEQVTTTSGHNSSIEYNKTLESTTSNNDYDLGLATPYGISAANFVLDRDVAQPIVDDTVPLLVDFHSSHKIKNLNIPIGIEVTPWDKTKLIVPSFKVGGGFNYITQITNQLESIDTHHGAISFNKNESMDFAAPTIQTVFFDIQLGLTTSISLSKTLEIEIEYSWKKGLNPIFKQSDYNTTINRHFLSAGLSKTLGK